MTIGFLGYALLTFAFFERWSVETLCFSLLLSHAPDLDMPSYILMRKRLPYRSHWLVGHHPMLIVPLWMAIAAWMSAALQVETTYLVSLAAVNVTAHFIHDSLQPQGLHWLSPFSWQRFTLRHGCPEHVPKGVWKEIFRKKDAHDGSMPSAGEEISTRSEPVSPESALMWTVSLCLAISVKFIN
jgi:hypothetical protein